MTPEEARIQARALLQSTDALLGGLLAVATQLREAVAVMQDTIDQTEPANPYLKREVGTEPNTTPANGLISFNQLHEDLAMAGIHLKKNTLNSYACNGTIPCEKVGKHRMFRLKDVLSALDTNRRKTRHHENTPPITVTGRDTDSAAESG